MLRRRESRILALNYLYALDLNKTDNKLLENFSSFSDILKKTDDKYATMLFKTAFENITKTDEELNSVIDNWSLDRLSLIDKAILRLACAELSLKETPINVIIDEVLEISKEFCELKATAFINGVLDKWVLKYLQK